MTRFCLVSERRLHSPFETFGVGIEVHITTRCSNLRFGKLWIDRGVRALRTYSLRWAARRRRSIWGCSLWWHICRGRSIIVSRRLHNTVTTHPFLWVWGAPSINVWWSYRSSSGYMSTRSLGSVCTIPIIIHTAIRKIEGVSYRLQLLVLGDQPASESSPYFAFRCMSGQRVQFSVDMQLHSTLSLVWTLGVIKYVPWNKHLYPDVLRFHDQWLVHIAKKLIMIAVVQKVLNVDIFESIWIWRQTQFLSYQTQLPES